MYQPNTRSTFDDWSRTYDRDVTRETGFPFEGYGAVLERVLTRADVRPGYRVLELGVGTGNLTALLDARDAVVWGIDFSPEMLAIARRKVPRANLARADLLGDLPSDFPRSFEVAVSSYVFHEFALADKLTILDRLFAGCLEAERFAIIGDIGFPDAAARDLVRSRAGDGWDEEHYWLADETVAALGARGYHVDYEQVSICGAVLVVCRSQDTFASKVARQ